MKKRKKTIKDKLKKNVKTLIKLERCQQLDVQSQLSKHQQLASFGRGGLFISLPTNWYRGGRVQSMSQYAVVITPFCSF